MRTGQRHFSIQASKAATEVSNACGNESSSPSAAMQPITDRIHELMVRAHREHSDFQQQRREERSLDDELSVAKRRLLSVQVAMAETALDALTAHYTSTWKPEAAPVPGCAQDTLAVRGAGIFDSSRPHHFLAELTISSSVLHPDRDKDAISQNNRTTDWECCEEEGLNAITYECRRLCTLPVLSTLTVDAIISKEWYALAVCSSDSASGHKAFHSILDAVACGQSKLIVGVTVVHSLTRERMLHEAQRLHGEVQEQLPLSVSLRCRTRNKRAEDGDSPANIAEVLEEEFDRQREAFTAKLTARQRHRVQSQPKRGAIDTNVADELKQKLVEACQSHKRALRKWITDRRMRMERLQQCFLSAMAKGPASKNEEPQPNSAEGDANVKLRLLEVAQKKAAELAANMEVAHREQVAEMRESLARKRRGEVAQSKDSIEQSASVHLAQGKGNADSTSSHVPSAQAPPAAPQEGTVARCRKEVEEQLKQSAREVAPTLKLREEPRKVDADAVTQNAAEPEANGKDVATPQAEVAAAVESAAEPEASGNSGTDAAPEIGLVFPMPVLATAVNGSTTASEAAQSSLGRKVSAVQEAVQADRYKEALMHDSEDHSAWCGLAALLRGDEHFCLMGQDCTKRTCIVRTLSCSGGQSADAWIMLGDLLGANEDEVIGTLHVSKRDCYVRALELDALRSDAWHSVASCVTDSVKIHERDVTKVDCYLESLRLNPQQSRVWYELGTTLSANGGLSAPFRGATYSCTDCLAEALKLSPMDPALWCNVACAMKAQDFVLFGSEKLSKIDCIFKSIKIEPKSSTWIYLASCITSGSVVLSGQAYCTMDCCREAVVLDPSPDNWVWLGNAMTEKDRLSIGGKEFNQRACFKEALRLDPKHYEAWKSLSNVLRLDEDELINDKCYSKLDCFMMAVTLNPRDSALWALLGRFLLANSRERITISGTSYSALDCFVKSLEINPTASVWSSLGFAINMVAYMYGEVSLAAPTPIAPVTVNGKQYTKADCCAEAVMLTPTAESWADLGMALKSQEKVKVGGKEYDSVGAFVESLKIKPTTRVWWFLGEFVGCVTIDGKEYDKKSCYAQALSLDPTNQKFWSQLIKIMEKKDRVTIKGQEYRKVDCLAESAHLSNVPLTGPTWESIRKAMDVGDTVVVGGQEYTSVDCLAKGLQEKVDSEIFWLKILSDLVSWDPKQRVLVRDRYYTVPDCVKEAVRINRRSSAWGHLLAALGPTDRIEFDGREYGRAECASETIRNAPRPTNAWVTVASLLSSDESFTYEGKEYNRVDCCLHALQLYRSSTCQWLDDAIYTAWEELGTLLEEGQCINVNEVRMSKLDCFVKAIEEAGKWDKQSPVLWGNVANLLGAEKSVAVGGKTLGKVECLIKLLELDKTNASAWCNLGYYAKGSGR